MKTSNETKIIFVKLAKAIKELESVKKSSDNPFFKSKYADLNTHLAVAEAALDKQGLILLQPVSRDERGSYVESIIIDPESSQFVSSAMDLVLGKQSMQDMGSAVTYARRYTLGALLSMQALDDDGEASMGRGKGAASAVAAPTTPAKRSSFRSKTGPAAEIVQPPANTATNGAASEDWS